MTPWQTRLTIIQDDITAQDDLDAIVNAANEARRRGGGVCGAIHEAAGPGLADACDDIGHCPTGEAVATPAFDLPCKHVIHTVGPIWGAGAGAQEDELLASCYLESLRVADDLGCKSIAFPSISTGTYGFPLGRAAPLALRAIRDGLVQYPDLSEVRLVCFSVGDLEAYEQALASIDETGN